MADLRIEREFSVSPEQLFQALSREANVLHWWGHDGMRFPDCALDFSRTGPWHCSMIAGDGTRFKMSGQVTRVEPPNVIGFTWAWHDDETDARGAESHVSFTVVPTKAGARLVLDHRDLPSDEIAERHLGGWMHGPMLRLERFLEDLPAA